MAKAVKWFNSAPPTWKSELVILENSNFSLFHVKNASKSLIFGKNTEGGMVLSN